ERQPPRVDVRRGAEHPEPPGAPYRRLPPGTPAGHHRGNARHRGRLRDVDPGGESDDGVRSVCLARSAPSTSLRRSRTRVYFDPEGAAPLEWCDVVATGQRGEHLHAKADGDWCTYEAEDPTPV